MRRRTSRRIDGLRFRQKVAETMLTYDEFAAAANVSPRTIGNAAAGGRVNLSTAAALAAALDCEVDDFSDLTVTEFADRAAS